MYCVQWTIHLVYFDCNARRMLHAHMHTQTRTTHSAHLWGRPENNSRPFCFASVQLMTENTLSITTIAYTAEHIRHCEIILNFQCAMRCVPAPPHFKLVHENQLWCFVCYSLYTLNVCNCQKHTHIHTKNENKMRKNEFFFVHTKFWRYVLFFETSFHLFPKEKKIAI